MAPAGHRPLWHDIRSVGGGLEYGARSVVRFRLLEAGACQYATVSLLLSAVRACRQRGYLKLVVEDSTTQDALCALLSHCGLHAPLARLRYGRHFHEFYLDLYWRERPGFALDFVEPTEQEKTS